MGSNNLISLEVKNFPHPSFLSHVDSNPFKILDLISVFCTSECMLDRNRNVPLVVRDEITNLSYQMMTDGRIKIENGGERGGTPRIILEVNIFPDPIFHEEFARMEEFSPFTLLHIEEKM